jgi:hypothetical protein
MTLLTMFYNERYCLALNCSSTQYPLANTTAWVGWMSFTACGRAPHIHNIVHVSGKFEHIIICRLLVFEKHKGCLEIVDVFILD